MSLTDLVCDQLWGRLSGNQSLQVIRYTGEMTKIRYPYRGDYDIDIFGLLQKQLHLGLDELLGHDLTRMRFVRSARRIDGGNHKGGYLSVSTSTITVFLDIHFQKLRSERFHLFTSSRTGIETSDDSTHSPRLRRRVQYAKRGDPKHDEP